jgi:hypothetical protein
MAQTAINTAAIRDLLRPGLAAVFSDSDLYGHEYADIFTSHKSDKAEEWEVEMKLLGAAEIKPEGTPISVSDMQEMFKTVYRNQTTALSFIITDEACQDNLYKDQFPRASRALKDSMLEAKNIQAGNVMNFGFSALNPLGDGQPLFSLTHPIIGGTVANTFAIGVALSETALEDANIGIAQFLSAAGRKIARHATQVVVGPNLEYTAERILGSKYRTGTANNDINAIYATNRIPKGVVINHFITSPTFWMVQTNETDGFKLYQRQELKTDIVTDDDTNNLKCKAWERYSLGCSNFRAAFGSAGA